MSRTVWFVLLIGASGLMMISVGFYLFSAGISAADAGTGQGAESASIPLLAFGIGVVLLISSFVSSGPVFEKKVLDNKH
ncbi:hypothetical protein [Corynebacterium sp. KPL3739]|uniref:hypothetical protein n=2 Tax=Corynebacteriaceae TaxID=1653 RepID=UPI0032EF9E1E